MKIRMAPHLLLFLLPGCKTLPPAEPVSSLEDAVSIWIECRNEKNIASPKYLAGIVVDHMRRISW